MTSTTSSEVKQWVLSGCRWKNNAFYSNPLDALTRGDTVLSHQYVFIDVLDCVFARGEYRHLRPTGRSVLCHSDASFSRNIYSQASPENIPLQITKKYPSNPTGIELARNEWEYEKITRGNIVSSQEHSITTTPITKEKMKPTGDTCLDVNLMIRECAFSFLQVWLSQIIHDSDLQSEKIALSILHKVAKLPHSTQNNDAYIQSIRNIISQQFTSTTSTSTITTATEACVMKNIFVLLVTRDLVQDLRHNWGCTDLHRLRLPIRYTMSEGHMWENVSDYI
jgi:hypothetical protein